MNTLVLLAVCLVILFCGYVFYGRWLVKQWGVGEGDIPTPAHTMNDGIDYVPAKAPVLMGHHFSSIAGAGPITGPIGAAMFGWLPVTLWVLIGGIFFGGVHDFGALFASVRHKGQSIGEIISANMSKRAKQLFIIFSYLTLILVVAAFAAIVASTFGATYENGVLNEAKSATQASVAMVSLLFILVAIVFGFAVYRRHTSMVTSTILGVAAIVACMAVGMNWHPLYFSTTTWMWLIGLYITIASVTPVWILLQPRDYLSSFLLYAMLAVAVVGIVGAHPDIKPDLFPAYTGFAVDNGNGIQYMFPILFTTVACGAISGFHSLVSSGTTSKQLDKERRHAAGMRTRDHHPLCHRLCERNGSCERCDRYFRRRHCCDDRCDPGTRKHGELHVHSARLDVLRILPDLSGYRDTSGSFHVPGILARTG